MTWQKKALKLGLQAGRALVVAGVGKVNEQIDRARRHSRGISDFDLVEVAGLKQPATFLPLDYLFWMGVTMEGFRSGNQYYSPQKFGGYWPSANDSSERRAEYREFTDRLLRQTGEDWIPLFWDGKTHLVDRDCATSKEVKSNLRLSRQDFDDVIDLPSCLVRRATSLRRVREDEIYRLELWNGEKWDLGLRSYAPFQSLDEDSDELVVRLAEIHRKQSSRRP